MRAGRGSTKLEIMIMRMRQSMISPKTLSAHKQVRAGVASWCVNEPMPTCVCFPSVSAVKLAYRS